MLNAVEEVPDDCKNAMLAKHHDMSDTDEKIIHVVVRDGTGHTAIIKRPDIAATPQTNHSGNNNH